MGNLPWTPLCADPVIHLMESVRVSGPQFLGSDLVQQAAIFVVQYPPCVDFDRTRTAHEIALDFVAAFAQQDGQLRLRLHTFRDDGQVQSMREPQHPAHNRRRLRIAIP